MKIQIYRFIGLSPLLMANIESVNRNLPQLKLGTAPNDGDIEKIAEGMAYKTNEGEYYVPTQAFRSSLLTGCTGQKFPGMRQSPKNIFKSLIFPMEERAIIVDNNGEQVRSHEIQIDSGVNSAGNSRIIIVRPRIDEWQTDVPFEIDEEFGPPNFDEFMQVLLQIWNRAGRAAGVGAWRPEKQGRFGRYSVEMI